MIGSFRVDNAAVPALAQISGKKTAIKIRNGSENIDVRFGIAPYKWCDTYADPFNLPCKTEYRKKKAPDITWAQHLDAMCLEAGPLGVAMDEDTL